MSRQLTVRGVPEEVADRLGRLSRARGQSVNSTVNQILEDALGVGARLRLLRRMPRWTQEEFDEVSDAVAAHRTIDDPVWR